MSEIEYPKPLPLEEWPPDILEKYMRWREMTAELGIHLPDSLLVSQWCEAHNRSRSYYSVKRREGQAPATVERSEKRVEIPLDEWARIDLMNKAQADAKLNPFREIFANIRREEQAEQHSAQLRGALQKAADAQKADTLIDATFIAEMSELDKMAWQADPEDALAQKQLKEARAGIFAAAQARWEARQKAAQS